MKRSRDRRPPGREAAARGTSVELPLDLRQFSRAVLAACIAAEIAFVVLDYHVNYGGLTEIGAIRRMFNSAREDGLASWFGITQTTLIALTLWFVVAVKRHTATARTAMAWAVVALFFTYMAIDDGAQIHERIGTAFETLQTGGSDAESGTGSASLLARFPSYTWQLVFLPLFGALGAFTAVLLWREIDENSARALVVLALTCFVAAVGLDFIEGLERDHPWNLYSLLVERFQLDDITSQRFGKSGFRTLRHFSKSLEESTEMLANSLLWFVILRHAMRSVGEVRLRFRHVAES